MKSPQQRHDPAPLRSPPAPVASWQVFIALVDYFQYTYHSNSVEFYFPAISTSVLVLTAALMALVGQRLSFRARIFWPSVVLVCFR
jgi:hypothetical protein